MKNRGACALTRAGGSLYTIKLKSAFREPDLSLWGSDPVPLSKIGTHLLASLGTKGRNGNSLACLRNAGSHSAESYCSINLVVTEGNSVLGPDLVEKVVMLRMNQGFTEMMRREYPQALNLKYPKLGTVVSPEDNVEDPEPSDKAPLRDCDME